MTSGWLPRSTPTLLSPQTTRSSRWPARVAVIASPAASRAVASSMLPGCTSATRTVDPAAGGAGPSTNQAGPIAAHASATASAVTRPGASRCSSMPAIAALTATITKLVSHTPPSEAEANIAGWFHCDAPSNAHGPPRLGHDRTASASTHALGNTTTAASVRRIVTGADSSRCAAHPHGSHNAPSQGGQHHEQRTRARQQPVLGGQHVPGHTAPRPHTAFERGRRGAHHQQQRDYPEPGQPPPGRRGKGKSGQRADDQCRRAAQPVGAQVLDALAIMAIDSSSVASNSSALCCAVSPSVSAREKLAMTPWLRARRSHASSRL